MTGLSIAEAILDATQTLRRGGVPDPRREAGSLLAHVLNKDRTFIITRAGDSLSLENMKTFRAYVDRRAGGEPLQYITGQQDFFGLDFAVNCHVLIPRPETELLAEAVLELLDPEQSALICDVGTGSGCIAVTLLHNRPQTRAVALDISEEALQVARRNATHHRLGERINFIASDCFAALQQSVLHFDLIVSNPPYVAEKDLTGLQREVREHEPLMALTSGADGLSIIRRLLDEAPAFLLDRGYLAMEIGYDQREAVERLIDPNVWKLVDIRDDLQGIPRIVVLRKGA